MESRGGLPVCRWLYCLADVPCRHIALAFPQEVMESYEVELDGKTYQVRCCS